MAPWSIRSEEQTACASRRTRRRDGEMIPLPVVAHPQGALAACAGYLRIGRLQRKDGAGSHHRLAAFGTEVAKGPHLFIHMPTPRFCAQSLGPYYSIARIVCTG